MVIHCISETHGRCVWQFEICKIPSPESELCQFESCKALGNVKDIAAALALSFSAGHSFDSRSPLCLVLCTASLSHRFATSKNEDDFHSQSSRIFRLSICSRIMFLLPTTSITKYCFNNIITEVAKNRVLGWVIPPLAAGASSRNL